MKFIYDIVVNFEKDFFEFYEWEKEDNIINIKKIPLFLISNETYKNIKYNNVSVNSSFVDKIRDKTFAYNKIKFGPSCLITNGVEAIGIMLDNNGNVIKKSSLLIDEEDEILEEATDIDVYDIIILNKRKIINNNGNRRENKKKKFLINYINKESNTSNLKYLYYDYFEKENEDVSFIKKKLISEINHSWNKRLNNFYETAKIINRIKN